MVLLSREVSAGAEIFSDMLVSLSLGLILRQVDNHLSHKLKKPAYKSKSLMRGKPKINPKIFNINPEQRAYIEA